MDPFHIFSFDQPLPSQSDTEDDQRLIEKLLLANKPNLSDEDRRILENRDLLKKELCSLQNASYDADISSPAIVINETHSYETLCPNTSEYVNSFPVLELLIDESPTPVVRNPLVCVDQISNLIQDENVKKHLHVLNEQLENNMLRYDRVTSQLTTLLAEKRILDSELKKCEDELKRYDEEMKNCNLEEARIKKIKKKKGAYCANTGVTKKTYFCRFGIPYFRTVDCYRAERNRDFIEISRSDQKMVMMMPKMKRFTTKDACFLCDRIVDQMKKKRLEKLRSNLKTQSEAERNIRLAIEETENVKSVHETIDWNIEIDFLSLENTRYSSDDCERIWNLICKPTLVKDDFSEDEMHNLRELVDKYGAQDWDRLATMLGTNRSGFMCFTKFMVAERKGKNLPWTGEEDELLMELGSKLEELTDPESRSLWWTNIRRNFPYRSYSQVYSHWTYVLSPSIKKGRFTWDEHIELERLRNEGKSYKEMSQIVKSRSCVQIRSHFEAATIDHRNTGKWTQDEIELLYELVDKYGIGKWAEISREMMTRNRTQCRLKYALLQENGEKSAEQSSRVYWSYDETVRFLDLVDIHGTNFRRISEGMRSKDYNQCRNKYFRILKSKRGYARRRPQKGPFKIGKTRDKWSMDEEQSFIELLRQFGNDFDKISEELKTKSRNQCRNKFFSMKKSQVLPAEARALIDWIVKNDLTTLKIDIDMENDGQKMKKPRKKIKVEKIVENENTENLDAEKPLDLTNQNSNNTLICEIENKIPKKKRTKKSPVDPENVGKKVAKKCGRRSKSNHEDETEIIKESPLISEKENKIPKKRTKKSLANHENAGENSAESSKSNAEAENDPLICEKENKTPEKNTKSCHENLEIVGKTPAKRRGRPPKLNAKSKNKTKKGSPYPVKSKVSKNRKKRGRKKREVKKMTTEEVIFENESSGKENIDADEAADKNNPDLNLGLKSNNKCLRSSNRKRKINPDYVYKNKIRKTKNKRC